MENKLYHGDMLEILKDFEDESIDAVVSDVPYKIVGGGVTIEETYNETGGMLQKRYKYSQSEISKNWYKNKTDADIAAVRDGKMFHHNDIKFSEFLPVLYRVLKKGTHCYIMINGRNVRELITEAEKVGFVFQNLLVWDKGNAVPNKYYMNAVEFIVLFSKRPARNINDMGTKNILRIPNILNGTRKHPTEKPMALMKVMVENSTNENEIVLDPFAGGGSTLMAAKLLNRRYIGIEIDDKYYQLIKNRIDGYENALF